MSGTSTQKAVFQGKAAAIYHAPNRASQGDDKTLLILKTTRCVALLLSRVTDTTSFTPDLMLQPVPRSTGSGDCASLLRARALHSQPPLAPAEGHDLLTLKLSHMQVCHSCALLLWKCTGTALGVSWVFMS